MVAMLNLTFTVMFTVIYEVHDLLQVSNMFLSFLFQFSNVSRYAANFKSSRFMLIHGTGDGKSK